MPQEEMATIHSRREAIAIGAAALSSICFSGCHYTQSSKPSDVSHIPKVHSDEIGPYKRGVDLGVALRSQILRATNWYHSLFNTNRFSISNSVLQYQTTISELLPQSYEELQGISVGAGVAVSDLVMLNSRSELLQSMWSEQVAHPSECSALWIPRLRCLAQTWDWALDSLSWCSVASFPVAEDLHTTIFSEAGMLGKIGVNSRGVGVLLTFVDGPVTGQGIPIHLLSRVVLECASVEEAIRRISRIPTGSSGALLIADKGGDSAVLEFFGGELSIATGHNEPMFHTNHLLLSHADEAIAYAHPADYQNSLVRFRDVRALQMSMENGGAQRLGEEIRSSNVCISKYNDQFLGDYGTCAVVKLDLNEGLLSLS